MLRSLGLLLGLLLAESMLCEGGSTWVFFDGVGGVGWGEVGRVGGNGSKGSQKFYFTVKWSGLFLTWYSRILPVLDRETETRNLVKWSGLFLTWHSRILPILDGESETRNLVVWALLDLA